MDLSPMVQQQWQQQVEQTERAFARSMAERNLEAFASFVSEEAVFFGDRGPLRGRQAVRDGWAPYFATPAAPFSWEPDQVEVLPSGTLAFSSGPVRNAAGAVIARFNSVWRLEQVVPQPVWRVVFDKGSPWQALAPASP